VYVRSVRVSRLVHIIVVRIPVRFLLVRLAVVRVLHVLRRSILWMVLGWGLLLVRFPVVWFRAVSRRRAAWIMSLLLLFVTAAPTTVIVAFRLLRERRKPEERQRGDERNSFVHKFLHICIE
jgi:NADH:ubiquinone oxidoreductase subunit K